MNLKGYNPIYKILEQALAALINCDERSEGILEESLEKNPSFKIIVHICKISHKVLSIICKGNSKIQQDFFKRIETIFMLQHKYNLGQLELINAIFKDNPENVNKLNEGKLIYFINLIERHGRVAHFLDFFETILTIKLINADSLELRKKIISVLFYDDNFHYLDVSQEYLSENHFYTALKISL